MHERYWKTWTILGVVAVLGALVVWYIVAHPLPVHAPVGGTSATQSASLDEHAKYYDITANYPSKTALAGVSYGADMNAVARMKAWEQDTIAQFKTDGNFANLTPADVQMIGLDENKESLQITFATYSGAHTVSYVFTTFEDTLGAHPNSYYYTFTFDTATGMNLKLADLFGPKTDYLGRLSTISRTALPPIIAEASEMDVSEVDSGMLSEGTTPTTDNFSSFYIDGSNLVFLFPPYQVAPYSAGSQTLSIPLSSLSDILKSTYQK